MGSHFKRYRHVLFHKFFAYIRTEICRNLQEIRSDSTESEICSAGFTKRTCPRLRRFCGRPNKLLNGKRQSPQLFQSKCSNPFLLVLQQSFGQEALPLRILFTVKQTTYLVGSCMRCRASDASRRSIHCKAIGRK